MGGILSQGKIWNVPFHEEKPSEMKHLISVVVAMFVCLVDNNAKN